MAVAMEGFDPFASVTASHSALFDAGTTGAEAALQGTMMGAEAAVSHCSASLAAFACATPGRIHK